MRSVCCQTYGLLVLAIAAISVVPCRGDTIFSTTVNTSGLSAGTYNLDFELIDGSGPADNNTATISHFDLTGGGVLGSVVQTADGVGAGSDLNGTVTLTDEMMTLFVQAFTPGSSLSFTVDLTTNVDSGMFPDEFLFTIDDGINLLGGGPQQELVSVNLDSAQPTIDSYDGAGLTTMVQAAPLPSSLALGLALLAIGGIGMLLRRTRYLNDEL